jgi:hypothetical protein
MRKRAERAINASQQRDAPRGARPDPSATKGMSPQDDNALEVSSDDR